MEILKRSELHVASQSEIVVGPQYAYMSGECHSVIDNILLDAEAATFVSSCTVYEMDDLSTSDHLPFSIHLALSTPPGDSAQEIRWPKINWEKAKSDGSLAAYQKNMQALLSPLVGQMYEDVEHLNTELKHVALLGQHC